MFLGCTFDLLRGNGRIFRLSNVQNIQSPEGQRGHKWLLERNHVLIFCGGLANCALLVDTAHHLRDK